MLKGSASAIQGTNVRWLIKKIKARLLAPCLGGKTRLEKALLGAKFENDFEEILDEVGDFIGISQEALHQFL